MITHSAMVDVRVNAPSGTIILNRPSRCNALNGEMVARLQTAFQDLHQEKKVSTVILTGAGETFCSGTDLKDLHSELEASSDPQVWHDQSMALNELIATMLRFPKPIIAAVNGPALGLGLGLALASDLVIGGPTATFGAPEIRRGLVPGLVTPLLAFRFGAALAARVSLMGVPLNADESLKLGICQEVVAKDNLLWARANELAAKIAEGSPQATQMTKTLINETIGEEFFTHLNLGTANSAAARTTESAKEGVDAFVKKRPPNWQ